MIKICTLIGISLLALNTNSDIEQIEGAATDYADAYYQVRPDFVDRSIHADLVKLGYKLQADGKYATTAMNFAGFHAMVDYFNSNDLVPSPGPKEVEVLDALDQTALVKLTGSWGTDYMQLAKFDGRWMTRHALWQTAPQPRSESEQAEDETQIETAVREYLEAIYLAQPERIANSVDTSMTKYGFERSRGSETYTGTNMTFDQLVKGAGSWYANRPASADALREIEVLDVMDKIACAKLSASWGIDYMSLAKLDGKWMIQHIIWQSHPAKSDG